LLVSVRNVKELSLTSKISRAGGTSGDPNKAKRAKNSGSDCWGRRRKGIRLIQYAYQLRSRPEDKRQKVNQLVVQRHARKMVQKKLRDTLNHSVKEGEKILARKTSKANQDYRGEGAYINTGSEAVSKQRPAREYEKNHGE